MPTIVTIHGTFAAGPEEGDQWWQRGSPFERHLRECVEAEAGDLSFERLHWDGHNSEASRWKAAEDLMKWCKALESRGESYCLIGHSHGGSVISNALLLAGKDKLPLPNMSQAITVGTPFIHLARTNFLLRIPIPVLFVIALLVALNAVVESATTPGTTLNRQLVDIDPAFARKMSPPLSSRHFSERLDLFKLPPPSGTLRDTQNPPPSSATKTTQEEQNPEKQEKIKRLSLEQIEKEEAKRAAESRPFALDIISRTFMGIAFLVCVQVVKLFSEERVADGAISQTSVREASKMYASRWLGFAHGLDEAIRGLSRLTSARLVTLFWAPIAEKKSSFAFSFTFALLVVVLGVLWLVLFSAANELQPAFSGEFISGFLSAALKSPGQALRMGLIVAIMFVAGLVILAVVSALMYVTLVRAGGLVDQLLQQLLLGMNIPGQKATTISDRPMWSSMREPVAMPADLAQQMMIFDDSQSLVVVNALRRELYTALKPRNSAAIPNLSEVMAAFELTHTTYFNSPLFRKLMFAALAEQPGLRATSVFAADPDYNRLRQWLKHPEGSASEDSSGHRLQT